MSDTGLSLCFCSFTKHTNARGVLYQVRINPKYAAEHQLAVIDCLEDPDDTLKKKTLELLFKMAKPNNVEASALLQLGLSHPVRLIFVLDAFGSWISVQAPIRAGRSLLVKPFSSIILSTPAQSSATIDCASSSGCWS